jgi:hypothetical protein
MNRIGVGGRCCLILFFIGIFVVMDAEPTSDPAEIAKSQYLLRMPVQLLDHGYAGLPC